MSKGLLLLAERLAEAEQQCALALVKAQQDLKLFMDQQNALNQYRQIYHQQWTDRGLQGISPLRIFANTLDGSYTMASLEWKRQSFLRDAFSARPEVPARRASSAQTSSGAIPASAHSTSMW